MAGLGFGLHVVQGGAVPATDVGEGGVEQVGDRVGHSRGAMPMRAHERAVRARYLRTPRMRAILHSVRGT